MQTNEQASKKNKQTIQNVKKNKTMKQTRTAKLSLTQDQSFTSLLIYSQFTYCVVHQSLPFKSFLYYKISYQVGVKNR